jgi:hypothetical protein
MVRIPLVRINSEESGARIRFDALAEYYLKADFGEDAVRQKSINTIPIVEHYVRDYLIVRWGNELGGTTKESNFLILTVYDCNGQRSNSRNGLVTIRCGLELRF